MRLSKELVLRNNLGKLGKGSRTHSRARHPPHSTTIIIMKIHHGKELHDEVLIVLVRELTERYDPQPTKSIIHPGIDMSIVPQVLHINLLVGSKLLCLDHHQHMKNTMLVPIAESWVHDELSGIHIRILLTES